MGLWRLVAPARNTENRLVSARRDAVQSWLLGLHLPAWRLLPGDAGAGARNWPCLFLGGRERSRGLPCSALVHRGGANARGRLGWTSLGRAVVTSRQGCERVASESDIYSITSWLLIILNAACWESRSRFFWQYHSPQARRRSHRVEILRRRSSGQFASCQLSLRANRELTAPRRYGAEIEPAWS